MEGRELCKLNPLGSSSTYVVRTSPNIHTPSTVCKTVRAAYKMKPIYRHDQSIRREYTSNDPEFTHTREHMRDRAGHLNAQQPSNAEQEPKEARDEGAPQEDHPVPIGTLR
jgi:hypothetical protein